MTNEQIQKVKEEGYAAGYQDDGAQCPYPENSDEEYYWLSGYGEGLDGYSRSFDL